MYKKKVHYDLRNPRKGFIISLESSLDLIKNLHSVRFFDMS